MHGGRKMVVPGREREKKGGGERERRERERERGRERGRERERKGEGERVVCGAKYWTVEVLEMSTSTYLSYYVD
jgi:hypothetical protein